MAEQPASGQVHSKGYAGWFGILLGLPPFLLFTAMTITRHLQGHPCGYDLVLTFQRVSVILWCLEFLLAIVSSFGIFRGRLRRFGLGLLLVLLVSIPLGLGLWYLWFIDPPGCYLTG